MSTPEMDVSGVTGEFQDFILDMKNEQEKIDNAILDLKELLRSTQSTSPQMPPDAIGKAKEFDKHKLVIEKGLRAIASLIRLNATLLNAPTAPAPVSMLPEPETTERSIIETPSGSYEEPYVKRIAGMMRGKMTQPQAFRAVAASPLQRLIQKVELARIRWLDFIDYHYQHVGIAKCMKINEFDLEDEYAFFSVVTEPDVRAVISESFVVEVKEVLVQLGNVTGQYLRSKAQVAARGMPPPF